jgi:hypothetical protein
MFDEGLGSPEGMELNGLDAARTRDASDGTNNVGIVMG